MTLPEWAIKQDDDFQAPQPIVVMVGGEAADLTDPDWSIAIQARPRNPADSATVIDFGWLDDEELLSAGKIVPTLARTVSKDMAEGGWVWDIAVTNDTIAGVGRQRSVTVPFGVARRITDVEEP